MAATPASARRPLDKPWPRPPGAGVDDVLNISRLAWGADPAGWLRSMALAADEAGFAGIALMDHLIQIPQVDRAWEPIPSPRESLIYSGDLGRSL